jgi:hypothetical protein
LTAATIGVESRVRSFQPRNMLVLYVSSNVLERISEMSAPAAKAFSLVDARTMHPMASSRSKPVVAHSSSSKRAEFSAFRALGRFRRMIPTFCRVSTRMFSYGEEEGGDVDDDDDVDDNIFDDERRN